MKDPAFQSQVFAEQVAQRQQRSYERQGDAVQTGVQSIIQNQQAAQALHMRELETRSAIASQEIQRQQAAEELAWARELHTSDMLELQKRGLAAQTDAARAAADLQIAKANREREGYVDAPVLMTPEHLAAMRARGLDSTLVGNRLVVTEADPEVKKQGEIDMRILLDKKYQQRAPARGSGGGASGVRAPLWGDVLRAAESQVDSASTAAADEDATPAEREAARRDLARARANLDAVNNAALQGVGIQPAERPKTVEEMRSQQMQSVMDAVQRSLQGRK